MARKSTAHPHDPGGPDGRDGQTAGRRELIVLTRPGAGPASGAAVYRARSGSPTEGMARLLADVPGATVRPLFGPSGRRSGGRVASLPADDATSDLAAFHHVDAPDERLDELAESLRRLDEVAAAYVKPAGEPPQINDMAPSPEEPPATTPDFTGRQGYLDVAPGGIDARYAWLQAGGRGAGVNIIDCEWGWRFTHEDLAEAQGGVVIGVPSADDNHGTAVLGEIGGDPNAFGVTGVCPDAFVRAASFLTLPTAMVIRQAADRLRPGDVILLEIHRPGPGASGAGQDGYIAIEWWPDDLAAIQYAVARGVVVVEAAGNGARNLDDAIYDRPAAGFPSTWRNPFDAGGPDSGAIIVGAGAPPPGTHGQDHGPDRSRLDFSNYGRRLDAQGWGREVTSTGYGDLQGGDDRDLWYTDRFSGTSSASPIVVGAVACLQGAVRALGRPPLTPGEVRRLLRTTGTPQQDAPGRPRTERIGSRPDLRQLLGYALNLPSGNGELTRSESEPSARQLVINVNSPRVLIKVGGGSGV